MDAHPYAEIFPLLDRAALNELVADIREHGLREPIWLYEGKILDGRNRFLACKEAGIKPTTRKFTGKDPLAFVISSNLHRRHLTDAQRAMAAARIATLRLGANQHSEGVPIGTSSKMLNVSSRTAKRAKKVVEKGSSALLKAVDSGEVSISKASAVTDLPKSKQLAAAQESKPEPTFDLSDFEPDTDIATERAQAEIDKAFDAVMASDDRFPAMEAEIKRLAAQLAIAEQSRDHYMNECGTAVRMLKAEQRKTQRLEKSLQTAEAELGHLRSTGTNGAELQTHA